VATVGLGVSTTGLAGGSGEPGALGDSGVSIVVLLHAAASIAVAATSTTNRLNVGRVSVGRLSVGLSSVGFFMGPPSLALLRYDGR